MEKKRPTFIDSKGGEPTRLIALSDGLFATVFTSPLFTNLIDRLYRGKVPSPQKRGWLAESLWTLGSLIPLLLLLALANWVSSNPP